MNASCLAAVHNRPSVVSPQFAGALPRTGAHILSMSTATDRCCPSHCRTESVDAVDRSPAPASCAFCTISLGGSVRLHPTVPNMAAKAPTAAIHLTGDSSHYHLMGSRSERPPIACNAAIGKELFCGGFVRRILLKNGRLIRLLARKVSQHDLPQFHHLLRLLLCNVSHHLDGPDRTIWRGSL